MKNKKAVLRFIIVFIISFLVLESAEWVIEYFTGIDLHNLEWGWLGFIIVYGFKYHVLCCLIPAFWAAYKCKHKKCEHEYCDADS